MNDDERLGPQYLESIRADTDRMVVMGERGIEAAVPYCQAWNVADLVRHVAAVYANKVQVMANNAWPTDWPDFASREPVEVLRVAGHDLLAEFARHDPAEETTTFVPYDGTIGFWMRRLALEALVHRYDAESAHKQTTSVPPDLSLDGIDEVFSVFLAAGEGENVSTAYPIDALIAVESCGKRWLADLRAHSAEITLDADRPAAATISGEPQAVFLWLWGRQTDDAVGFQGDLGSISQFRARLAECTQ